MKSKLKLGANKGLERSRIWLDNSFLRKTGFTRGKYYVREYIEDTLKLRLCNDADVYSDLPKKISGKKDNPLIDITGFKIREFFGEICTHVDVQFTPGLIIITPHLVDE